MSPRTHLLLPLVLLLVALGAAPAGASPVLRVGPTGTERADDPYLPASSDLLDPAAPAASGERACAAGESRPVAAPPGRATAAASGPSVADTLDRLVQGRAITAQQRDGYLNTYRSAKATRDGLEGTRRNELASVVGSVEALAKGKKLTASRLPIVFLELQRNAEYWPTRPFPTAPAPKRKPCAGKAGLGGARVTFEGDPVIFQWYMGQGLRVQELANFGQANGLAKACTQASPKTPCDRPALKGLLDRMVTLASRRGSSTAWEYFFTFSGGRPPWASGLAQGTAIQALTRGSQLLGDPSYLRVAHTALGLFKARAPVGVRAPSGGGSHYLIYSFAPGLRVANAFLQSLIGLYDYGTAAKDPEALKLFAEGDGAARREIPRFDTGAWSLYSLGGAESDLGYHTLLRDFLVRLCQRTRAKVYCDTGKHFSRDLRAPVVAKLTGPRKTRAKRRTPLAFSLSKVSCVTVTVADATGATTFSRRAVFERGGRTIDWTPAKPGTYTVSLRAEDLPGHVVKATGPVVVQKAASGG